MGILKNNVINGIAYALATTGAIVGETRGMEELVLICRPAMMIILSSWFFFNSRRVGDRFTLLIQAGLFFSLVADVAFMLQHYDEFNFLIGIGSMLIAILCYTIAFIHNIADVGGEGMPLLSLGITIVVITYAFLFGTRSMPYMDEGIGLPMLIYATAMTCMSIAAAFRAGRTFIRSFLMVLIGTFFFIASGSIMGTNRFMAALDHSAWSVTLTYAIAQYLIAAGCLAHVLDPEEIRRKAALSA